MIKSDRVYLRLMERKDVPYKVKWVNDPDVRRTLFFQEISELGTEQWLNKVALDSTRKDFIICDLETDNPIGFASVVKIDLMNSKAETYLCIGDKEYWGKGYGTEVKRMLLRYVFIELGLNKVYSYNWVENKRMIEINKKLGFTLEGQLRKDIFANGEYKDRVIFSMLKEEYLKLIND